jgi:sigma-B regulation protein RsbU (phosphoserine phosphatase)
VYNVRLAGPTRSKKVPLSRDALAELLPIVGELSAVLDPGELLQAIAKRVRRLVMGAKVLDIYLSEADGSLAPALAVGYDQSTDTSRRIRIGEGVVGAAAASREPVFAPDVARDPRYITGAKGVSAELAIPLVHRDRLIGVLNIEADSAAAFTEEVRAALGVLAGHLAIAIENATLHRETRWYAGLLAILYDIAKETASILDLDLLLHRVAELVKRVIDYEMFGILLLDPASGDLVLRKSVRYGAAPERYRIRAGEGLSGAAVASKEPILVNDVHADPRYLSLIAETRSELVIPLVHKDRVVGVFDLESTALGAFTEEHVKVLVPLASQVAVAIENARLYEELRARDLLRAREMRIAANIQHGLFPEGCPRGRGWEASAHFRPARELGGDLYDFYEMEEGLLGVAVGDVAGKGVPAALYGAFASGTVRSRAFERHPPAYLMTRVNRTLRRRGVEGLLCNLVYALFDLRSRTVALASSGLPHPMHYQVAARRCLPVEIGGLPLGAFDDSSYEERTLPLHPGDIFVFYTDGLTDAALGGEEYGQARLRAVVEAHAGLPAPDLGGRILDDFDAFMKGSEHADDLTVVVLKVLGP